MIPIRVYVPCTPEYEPAFQRLEASLQEYEINPILLRYASRGSWEENTRYRSQALPLEYLDPDIVCWLLDADLEVRADPRPILHGMRATADVALCYRHDRAAADPSFRIGGGVVGWRGRLGRAFVGAWALRCQNYDLLRCENSWTPHALPEQAMLSETEIAAARTETRIVALPPEVNAAPQDLKHLFFPPILVNGALSRTMRKKIGATP